MSLSIYNTLSRTKEEFIPLQGKNVGMYVCGPTVYGMPHVGHAKSYVSFDIIHRYLTYLGYNVKYVQNITDVGHLVGDSDEGEDKIQKQARLEALDPVAIAYRYETLYFDCMDALGVRKPTISCRATGHIIEIISMVQELLDKGYAYVTDAGNVYYRVSSFKDYGKLSHREIDETVSGSRISVADDKEQPEDFALWKKADGGHLMKWPSPWGEGYPGWHIECSVMSRKYLGETFDIHGGGIDNMFPHHDCEIAQSEAANGCPFVKYFVHNNLVTVNGQKMGKSLGNFITLPDLFAEFDPMLIRFYILQAHYRKPTDFDRTKIAEVGDIYDKLCASIASARRRAGDAAPIEDADAARLQADFEAAMNDDFNTALAISTVYELSKTLNTECAKGAPDAGRLAALLRVVDECFIPVLGLTFAAKGGDDSGKYIEYILQLRADMRKEKRFDVADRIRDDLAAMGVEVLDGKAGSGWRLK